MLLTAINFATILAAVVVLLEFPVYAPIAFYVLLGWMVGSLLILYHPRSSPPASTSTAASGAPGPGGGPLVASEPPLLSTMSGQHSSALGFCMYCAAPVTPGTTRCPACGHALPNFA